MQKKLHIKKGDTVMIISGAHKGTKEKPKTGKIIEVDRAKLRAKVEGINLVKKHSKPSAKNPQGGIVEEEAGIHVSNLMLVVDGKPSPRGKGAATAEKKTTKKTKKTKEVTK
ncbi:MAG TPA: 50S ribosomal protein L24 [Flavobacteriales bacterium]|nr:50S ribosomal protein L24 [Flavobacteriales bacterium]